MQLKEGQTWSPGHTKKDWNISEKIYKKETPKHLSENLESKSQM